MTETISDERLAEISRAFMAIAPANAHLGVNSPSDAVLSTSVLPMEAVAMARELQRHRAALKDQSQGGSNDANS